YPMSDWLLDGQKRNPLARRKLFRVLTRRIGSQQGIVYKLKSGLAASIWIPSEQLGNDTFFQNMALLLQFLPATGLSRLWRLVAIHREMSRHHPYNEAHCYLFLIGVRPQFQRQGIGSRLLSAGLKLADAQCRAAFLETSVEENVSFYKNFGFKVIATYHI